MTRRRWLPRRRPVQVPVPAPALRVLPGRYTPAGQLDPSTWYRR